MLKIQNYINGELLAPLSGKYLDNIESATVEIYSLIPDLNSGVIPNLFKYLGKLYFIWLNTKERHLIYQRKV